MFSRLYKHVGTAGLVVAVVALVAALGGGAYAATGSFGGGAKATASAKGKPGPRGKQGKTGPAGPAGAKGDTGATGAAGSKGDTGATGPAGPKGDPGAKGTPGVTGQPWVPDNTLPPGATLTGAWAAGIGPAGASRLPISFSIPLAAPLDAAHVHYLKATDPPTTECPGDAADPSAASGHLCVYTGIELEFFASSATITHFDEAETAGADVAGADFLVALQGASASGAGTWAVTG